MPRFRVPPPFRGPTHGAEDVEVKGATLRACIEAAEALHPGFRAQLLAASGEPHRFVRFALNGTRAPGPGARSGRGAGRRPRHPVQHRRRLTPRALVGSRPSRIGGTMTEAKGPTGDRMIRVDMTNQTARFEPFPAEWKLLGGRALSAKILLAECDPKCDPLGPDNVLVMAPGVISGHRRAHLGPHLDRREEPAHGRHQGGQRRRQSRPGPDEARHPRHRGEGPAAGSEQALRARGHRRRRAGRAGRRVQGPVELRALREARQEVRDARPSSRSGPPARCASAARRSPAPTATSAIRRATRRAAVSAR